MAIGRLRAGKSFLLTRYLREKRGFYYQATKTTKREQLGSLTQVLAAEYPDSGLHYSAGLRNWDAFFELIIKQAGRQ